MSIWLSLVTGTKCRSFSVTSTIRKTGWFFYQIYYWGKFDDMRFDRYYRVLFMIVYLSFMLIIYAYVMNLKNEYKYTKSFSMWKLCVVRNICILLCDQSIKIRSMWISRFSETSSAYNLQSFLLNSLNSNLFNNQVLWNLFHAVSSGKNFIHIFFHA